MQGPRARQPGPAERQRSQQFLRCRCSLSAVLGCRCAPVKLAGIAECGHCAQTNVQLMQMGGMVT